MASQAASGGTTPGRPTPAATPPRRRAPPRRAPPTPPTTSAAPPSPAVPTTATSPAPDNALQRLLRHADLPRLLALAAVLKVERREAAAALPRGDAAGSPSPGRFAPVSTPTSAVGATPSYVRPSGAAFRADEALRAADRLRALCAVPGSGDGGQGGAHENTASPPILLRGAHPLTDMLMDDILDTLQRELEVMQTAGVGAAGVPSGGRDGGGAATSIAVGSTPRRARALTPAAAAGRGGGGTGAVAADAIGVASPTSSSASGTGGPIASKYSKVQIDALFDWMVRHADRPFPSAQDVEELMTRTGLSQSQVVNWTTNVRKRNRKATCERRKKPHHFLDFLFLKQHQAAAAASPQQRSARQSLKSRKGSNQGANETIVPEKVSEKSGMHCQKRTIDGSQPTMLDVAATATHDCAAAKTGDHGLSAIPTQNFLLEETTVDVVGACGDGTETLRSELEDPDVLEPIRNIILLKWDADVWEPIRDIASEEEEDDDDSELFREFAAMWLEADGPTISPRATTTSGGEQYYPSTPMAPATSTTSLAIGTFPDLPYPSLSPSPLSSPASPVRFRPTKVTPRPPLPPFILPSVTNDSHDPENGSINSVSFLWPQLPSLLNEPLIQTPEPSLPTPPPGWANFLKSVRSKFARGVDDDSGTERDEDLQRWATDMGLAMDGV